MRAPGGWGCLPSARTAPSSYGWVMSEAAVNLRGTVTLRPSAATDPSRLPDSPNKSICHRRRHMPGRTQNGPCPSRHRGRVSRRTAPWHLNKARHCPTAVTGPLVFEIVGIHRAEISVRRSTSFRWRGWWLRTSLAPGGKGLSPSDRIEKAQQLDRGKPSRGSARSPSMAPLLKPQMPGSRVSAAP